MHNPKSSGYSKKGFQNFVESNNVGVLAVTDEDWGIQATTVFYAVESEETLLIKSHTNSNHGKEMQVSLNVVLAIYDYESTYTEKSGVQLRCKVNRITDYNEMIEAVSIYSKAFPGAEKRFAAIEELISPDAKSTLFRLEIVLVKCLHLMDILKTFRSLLSSV